MQHGSCLMLLSARTVILVAVTALSLSYYVLLHEFLPARGSGLADLSNTSLYGVKKEPYPRNKTLVIVLGQTRAANVTFGSFKQHVLGPLDADLALSVSSTLTADLNGHDPYREAAKYIWEYPEVADWAEAYDYIQKVENTTGEWRRGLKIGGKLLWGGLRGFSGGAGIQFFFKWLAAKKIKELGLHYSRYVITRSDNFYEADHPVMDDKYIWVPEGEDYKGLCDRHMYLRHEELFPVLDMLHDMFHAPEAFTKWFNSTSPPYIDNAETFLAKHMMKVKLLDRVRRFPRMMYLVRADKTPTRWSKGSKKQAEDGAWVKYQSEYFATMNNIGKSAALFDPKAAASTDEPPATNTNPQPNTPHRLNT